MYFKNSCDLKCTKDYILKGKKYILTCFFLLLSTDWGFIFSIQRRASSKFSFYSENLVALLFPWKRHRRWTLPKSSISSWHWACLPPHSVLYFHSSSPPSISPFPLSDWSFLYWSCSSSPFNKSSDSEFSLSKSMCLLLTEELEFYVSGPRTTIVNVFYK